MNMTPEGRSYIVRTSGLYAKGHEAAAVIVARNLAAHDKWDAAWTADVLAIITDLGDGDQEVVFRVPDDDEDAQPPCSCGETRTVEIHDEATDQSINVCANCGSDE